MIIPRPASTFRRCGVLVALLAGLLAALVGGRAGAQTPGAGSAAGPGGGVPEVGKPLDYFELTGVVDQASARSLIQQVDAAERLGSEALIIRLDTPGGLRVSAVAIVDRLLAARIPVVVWIGPSGASAGGVGALIAFSANVVAMAPGTSLGPLVPVNLDALDTGPGPALAELGRAGAARGRDAGPLGNGSVRLSDGQAAQAGIATFEAGDLSTVLQNLAGKTVTTAAGPATISVATAPLRFHKMGLWARVEHTAARPAVAYMFLLLGFFGLVFELYFPGIGAAGLMGGASLAIGLYGFSTLPTSWLALLVLSVGILALVPDMHNGGLGLPTYAGTALVVIGSVKLFPHAPPALQLPWWAILCGVAGCLLFFISIMTAALRSRMARPPAGAQSLLGGLGLARTDIAPDGEVTADGSLWRARTVGAAIAEGSQVRVRSVSGLVLLVELAEESPETPAGPAGPTPGPQPQA